jgi:putative thioredoxin
MIDSLENGAPAPIVEKARILPEDAAVATCTKMNSTLAITESQFDAEVIDASARQPVLVDFWAPWCGPCRMLAPVLDSLAAETAGRLKVVKLNTDEAPGVAGRYQIRSIPAVKLFRDGGVVAEFVGAQPLSAVRAFVAPHLPRDPGSPLEQARQFAASGALDQAVAALRALRATAPADPEVAVELARALALSGDPAEAEALLGALPPVQQSEPAVKAARALAHFARVAASPDETDLIQTARVQAARNLLHGRVPEGLSMLFEAAERNRRFAAGQGREDLLKAFELASGDAPLLAASRRRLAGLLH